MIDNIYQCLNKNSLKTSKGQHREQGGQTPKNFLETFQVNNDEDLNSGLGSGHGENRRVGQQAAGEPVSVAELGFESRSWLAFHRCAWVCL